MNTGQIGDPSLHILPSEALHNYIAAIVKATPRDMSVGIANIVSNNKSTFKAQARKPADAKYLLTADDRSYLKTLNLKCQTNALLSTKFLVTEDVAVNLDKNEKPLLDLHDLHWLFDHTQRENDSNECKAYLHELLAGSQVLLPKNAEIPRNTQLERKCQKLKASQQTGAYNRMTRDVNVIRSRHPEDTVAYQMKQLNRHLMAVFQFVLSVIAGFAFGFVGVELIVMGNLDVGSRLLLGIVCSLIVALAELYFLAKRLNEDWRIETTVAERGKKVTKLD